MNPFKDWVHHKSHNPPIRGHFEYHDPNSDTRLVVRDFKNALYRYFLYEGDQCIRQWPTREDVEHYFDPPQYCEHNNHENDCLECRVNALERRVAELEEK